MDLSKGLTFSVSLYSMGMGLVSFASPCILPLIPSYVSYITGISYDELVTAESRRKNMGITLSHSIAFVAGFSLIFVLLGATASFAGSILSEHLDIIRIVGGILIILMGVFVMDVVNIPFLQREAKLHLKTRPAGYAGTAIVGMIFGAGWTPCTGPFLGSVLALAMTSETLGRGIGLLALYSLGLGIPFILSAVAISAFLTSFNRIKRHFKAIKIVSGAVLIVMGVLLMMDKMTILIPR
ncbi:MAG TPA: cytochrome c biogenesis protein CcdA [Nitrospirota bacterium]|nr:cytochrome c biogenesis protein CcdA [Nitrospirota bacterium]